MVLATPPPPTDGATALCVDDPKFLRVAYMLRALDDELPTGPLDDGARNRLASLETRILVDLATTLPDELQTELQRLVGSVAVIADSERGLRLVLAQLLGWVQGLMASGSVLPELPS